MTQAHSQIIKMLIEVRDQVQRELGLDPRSLGQHLREAVPGSKFILAEVKAELEKIANTPSRVWRMIMSTRQSVPTTKHFQGRNRNADSC